jgi:hypothetical protein
MLTGEAVSPTCAVQFAGGRPYRKKFEKTGSAQPFGVGAVGLDLRSCRKPRQLTSFPLSNLRLHAWKVPSPIFNHRPRRTCPFVILDHRACRGARRVGLDPKLIGNAGWLNSNFGPPIDFPAGAVQFAVMRPTKRYSELVADLKTETAGLSKAQAVGIAGLPAADQAGLLGDKSQVGFVAQPTQLRKGEQALVNRTRAGLRWRAF